MIADLLPHMVCGKAPMVGWVPVLRRNDQIEALLLFVGNTDHFISLRHGQGPTGEKVILNIDQDQSIHEKPPQRRRDKERFM
jgi:hypothetical protein